MSRLPAKQTNLNRDLRRSGIKLLEVSAINENDPFRDALFPLELRHDYALGISCFFLLLLLLLFIQMFGKIIIFRIA